MKKGKKSSLKLTKLTHPSAKKRRKEKFGLGKSIVLPLAVAKKRKLLEAIGHPSGKGAFVDEMGKTNLVLARIGGADKTRKPSKSAQNSILLLREAPPSRCEEKKAFGSSELASKRRVDFH